MKKVQEDIRYIRKSQQLRLTVCLLQGSPTGTEFAKKRWGDKPLLFSFRWRHHVYSTVVRTVWKNGGNL